MLRLHIEYKGSKVGMNEPRLLHRYMQLLSYSLVEAQRNVALGMFNSSSSSRKDLAHAKSSGSLALNAHCG